MVHPKKIVIISTGQPSTNPRMMKEVNALLSNGYTVKVFYSYWVQWAAKTDERLLLNYPTGVFNLVGGSPDTDKLQYYISKLFQKVSVKLLKYFPFLTDYSLSRSTFALAKAAKKEKADLYIAHNLGALPAAAKAAKKWHSKYSFDAEDYHRGEYDKPGSKQYVTTTKLEEKYIPGCAFATAAAPLIADAYKKLMPGVNFTVVNNVFSKVFLQPVVNKETKDQLNIFWFSQTIGANRGLEKIIEAINALPQYNITLHLMGACSDEYKTSLQKMINRPQNIYILAPVEPDQIFSIAAKFDIGLASEIPHNENRDYCLTNKLFVYLLSGNCILASDTLAQKKFIKENNNVGLLYSNHEVMSLTKQLEFLFNDRTLLNQYKKASVKLASEVFNWENESEVFVNIVAATV